jgi:hypothetical protein
MTEFINDIELVMLAIRNEDLEDALLMLQEIREEMIILDALNYD